MGLVRRGVGRDRAGGHEPGGVSSSLSADRPGGVEGDGHLVGDRQDPRAAVAKVIVVSLVIRDRARALVRGEMLDLLSPKAAMTSRAVHKHQRRSPHPASS
jgi:hypothetical protein